MEDDLVSIGSNNGNNGERGRFEEEKYARYIRDGYIVLTDKALAMDSQQKRKASHSVAYQQQTMRALSFPTAGRSRSHQTIERMTVTLTADQDSVDNMQPVYISTLEERLQVTGGASSSSTAYLHTENMDVAPTRKTAAELPILEHDIFKKFQQPTAAAKATSSTKRKMPLSFASLPLVADADLNSSNNSIVSISSPEQEVAASQDRDDINPKKKKKPKLHHETAEASGSSSEARDGGELIKRIRRNIFLCCISNISLCNRTTYCLFHRQLERCC